MKRLTKRQIAGLQCAAVKLTSSRGYPSCYAVSDHADNVTGARYGTETGALAYGNYFQEVNNLTDFEAQLARSLAVLMFIEANR